VPDRVVVLISGTGSNLGDLLSRCEARANPPVEVVAVGADRDATGLSHAIPRGIPTFVVSPLGFSSRDQWGVALGDEVAAYSPDLVVLSGFMRLVPPGFVARFSQHLINTHPAYLPEFPGAHAVEDQIAAGVNQAGASVITVDDGVDTGPILAQQRVAVEPHDTVESLHDRIKHVERELLWQVLRERTWANAPTQGESATR